MALTNNIATLIRNTRESAIAVRRQSGRSFLFAPAAAAGAIGLINSAGNVGGFVGPYLIGLLKDLTGSYSGGWVYLACSLIAAELLTLTLRKRNPGEGEARD